MHDDQRSGRFEPAVQFSQRGDALFPRDEVEDQQACRPIERPFRCIDGPALVQGHAIEVRTHRRPRQLEHVGRGIHSIEAPARMRVRQCLELHAATCTKHQDASVRRNVLGQQHFGHAVQAFKPRYLARRAVDIGMLAPGCRGGTHRSSPLHWGGSAGRLAAPSPTRPPRPLRALQQDVHQWRRHNDHPPAWPAARPERTPPRPSPTTQWHGGNAAAHAVARGREKPCGCGAMLP